MYKKENKTTINEVKNQLIIINNKLNLAISDSMETKYETDRETLRTLRDENIKTFLKLQELELIGMI